MKNEISVQVRIIEMFGTINEGKTQVKKRHNDI